MTDANSTVGTLARLQSLALITLSGEDRVSFLQGQLTNDVTKLGEALMRAGYCSPKGRLLATPRLFKEGETIGMIVAADQAAAIAKRLKMYVLRSKVTVTLDETRELFGYLGKATEALPQGCRVFAMADAKVEACIGAALPRGLGIIAAPKGSLEANTAEALWWAASAAAGEPWVFAKTADRFTAHAVNLDLAHGVSFNKGCYTGQEVVSRIEHIGKTNRRTIAAALAKPETLEAGCDLTDAEGAVFATVVYAAALADRTLMLAEVASTIAEADGPLESTLGTLHRLPLPYGWTRTN